MNYKKILDPALLKIIFPPELFEYSLLQGFFLAVPVMVHLCIYGILNISGLLVERILMLILFFLIGGIGPQFFRKTMMVLMMALTVLWDVADLFCLLQLHSQIMPSFWQLLETTNKNECAGFFKHTFFRSSNLLLLYPLAGVLIWKLCKNRRRILMLSALLGCIAVFILFLEVSPAQEDRVLNIYDRIDETLTFRIGHELKHSILEMANSELDVSVPPGDMTIVLIIGESHSKHHTQLYGYRRETSPLLKKRADSGDLAVFTDVVSPHSFTIYSIPKMLTLAAHGAKEEFWEVPNIFDLAKSAGFKTFWLCNQPAYSDFSMPYAAVTKRADVIKHSSPGNIQNHDGMLLPLYQEALNDTSPKKLIVLQLIGNHHDYAATYPENMRFFPLDATETYFNATQIKNRELMNHYDNSLRYNDFVVDSMIGELARQNEMGALVYVPDHGENLYEKPDLSMHMEFLPTRYTVEVPMYIWLSPKHPERKNVFAAVDRSFITEDLPYLILALGQMKYSGAKKERTLISPEYVPKKRVVSRDGMAYDILKNSVPE